MSPYKEGYKYKVKDHVKLMLLVIKHTPEDPDSESVASDMVRDPKQVSERLAELKAGNLNVKKEDIELLLLCYRHASKTPDMIVVTTEFAEGSDPARLHKDRRVVLNIFGRLRDHWKHHFQTSTANKQHRLGKPKKAKKVAKGIYKRQEAKAKAKKAPALLSSLNTVPVGGTSSQPPAYVKPLMEPGSLGFGRIETIAGAVRLVGYGASGSKP